MSEFRLPVETHITHAHLNVSNLQQSLTFYSDLMGFFQVRREDSTVALSAQQPLSDSGPAGDIPVQLVLSQIPDARPKPARTTGLYHVAIRFTDRRALAQQFRNLIENGWPFAGFADHGVSEALYLYDPDGNGLELYRDRAHDQWTYSNGELQMVTEPLDTHALLDEAATPWNGIDPGTDIGHIHLSVADLRRAERFYVDTLGMDVTQRSYQGALFVAAGGYHHHIGLNVWGGNQPPPPNAVGLRAFGIGIPDTKTWEEVVKRVRAANLPVEETGDGRVTVHDPDGNGVELMVG